jgi:hypothetical protein
VEDVVVHIVDFEISIARLLSFGRYMFDIGKYPLVQKLFGEPHFQQSAKKICPQDKQLLDPFQYNFIIQVWNPFSVSQFSHLL